MPRACAWAIDLVLRAAIMMVLLIAVSTLGELGMGIFLICAFLLEWIYPAVCEDASRRRDAGQESVWAYAS